MIVRRVTKVGGSLCVLVPRDIAEMVGLKATSSINLTIDGRRLLVEVDNSAPARQTRKRAKR
jgi:antitoxin component of MazEF toxin-antitoxin module